MWESLTNTEKIFAGIVVMGSIVDIFQFSWLMKKSYSGIRAKMEDRIRSQILNQQYKFLKEKDGVLFPGLETKEKK